MKLAIFVNWYFGGIRAGIQAGHAAMALAFRYRDDSKKHKLVEEFVKKYGTFALLNGGDTNGMQKLLRIVKTPEFELPWTAFYEDGVHTEPVLSAIAVLVPNHLDNELSIAAHYGGIEGMPKVLYAFTSFKQSCPLAT